MEINCIKKAVIFFAVLTFGCAVVFAEPPPPCVVPPPPDSNLPVCEDKGPDVACAPLDAPWFMQELSEKLNLTNAQKTAIEQIVANEAKEIQKIREDSRKQINAILTPEQQKEFTGIKGGVHKRMRRHAEGRLEILAEKLNLTEAQTVAIKPILAAEANDIKAIWQDNALGKEQKQSNVADIRKSTKEKINAVLTPEQQVKWAELKEAAGRMHRKGMRHGPGHKPGEEMPPPPPVEQTPPPPEEQEPTDSNS